MQQFQQSSDGPKVTLGGGKKRGIIRHSKLEKLGIVFFVLAYLVAQEERFELTFGPVVHGVGQQLHGQRVDTQEVAHKNHTLDILGWLAKSRESTIDGF